MLKKKICKRCTDECYRRDDCLTGWDDSDEAYWDEDKRVWCRGDLHLSESVDINGSPPECCPYFLEQIL